MWTLLSDEEKSRRSTAGSVYITIFLPLGTEVQFEKGSRGSQAQPPGAPSSHDKPNLQHL